MSPLLTELEKPILVAETDAHEGPVYAADEHALYFTTVRRDVVPIRRLDLASRTVSTIRADATQANGMALGLDGRLVVCEQGTHTEPARITAVDRATGTVEVLAEDGLASPNDVVVRSDGTIWFTDPSYGRLQGFRPEPEHPDRVYRLDPRTGRLDVVSESFDKPNGLAFTPDEQILYVGDSGAIQAPDDYDPDRPRRIVAFDVVGGEPRNERIFADEIPGYPDGLKVEFGAGHTVLYVTTDDAVWAVRIDPEGA